MTGFQSVTLPLPVFAHPDFSRPLILSTDASLDGLGAVLSQVPAGESKARPIAFASKTLSSRHGGLESHDLTRVRLESQI
jgi:hypothetical protein